jgi:integrase
MARTAGRRRRDRGSIGQLPSGRYRVRVYAGVDPLSGRQRYLVETAVSEREAERARTRLLNQVDERRQPRTNATVDQLLDRYFEVLHVEDSTRKAYVGYARGHIRPVLGKLQVGRVGAEVLDTFYAELRRCRTRCTPAQRRGIDHRTTREHVCDRRCQRHRCRPLAASTIRQIHWILSGAFDRAVKWQWIAVSPMSRADVPPLPTPSPQPPSVQEAARIASEAWKDPDWGTLVWVAMTTGIRRGELCAVRRSYIDFANEVLVVSRSVGGSRANLQEKDTKTHQQRRIALDSETL